MADKLQEAKRNIRDAFGDTYVPWIEGIAIVPGGDRKIDQIARCEDHEQLLDFLAEVRFCMVFLGLGCSTVFEPMGKKGPDLLVTNGSSELIVEVRRFRKVHHGPPIASEDGPWELVEYGDSMRDTRKSIQAIMDKFEQIHTAKKAVIAIWNDDGDLEEPEVEEAVRSFAEDANNGVVTLPVGLQFVLYGSPWGPAGIARQLYCYPLTRIADGFTQALIEDLEADTVSGLIARDLA